MVIFQKHSFNAEQKKNASYDMHGIFLWHQFPQFAKQMNQVNKKEIKK